jgi:predicted transcriptional regulator
MSQLVGWGVALSDADSFCDGVVDATIEDAIYRLHLLAKIDRGLAHADAGDLLSQDEIRRHLTPLAPRHGPAGDRI